MRELTIRRISGRLFHPCSAEFWLEDPAAAQQEIEGVGCRLLGTVEPEEEKSFWIPKTEVTVFVRMDWHGQIITAGSLTVPEGEDAVACTAKDQMLPGQSRSVVLSIAGSGVERKVMDQYQKAERVRKIVLVFSILAGIGIGLFFASRRPPTPKTITFDADRASAHPLQQLPGERRPSRGLFPRLLLQRLRRAGCPLSLLRGGRHDAGGICSVQGKVACAGWLEAACRPAAATLLRVHVHRRRRRCPYRSCGVLRRDGRLLARAL